MKKIKRILLTCLLCIGIISLFTLNIKMVNATKSDNEKGNWTPTETITSNVLGMEHLSVYGNANDTKPQHINVLSMKTDGYSSKLVSWSVTSENKKYTRQTLDVIAKDYEEKHPGWIVVGGINADQYTTGYGSDLSAGSAYFTPQTYYPLIMDGEARIPYTVNNIYTNHIGFANDGSENSLVAASPIKGFVLTVIDEHGNEITKFNIDKINEKPNENETTVWSTYISKSTSNVYVPKIINSSNDIYIITNPELAYMNNSVEYGGVNSIFGRGSISEIVKEKTLTGNQFAIESSNEAVTKALEVGTRIVVDAEYESEALNKVEASTGFHSVHRYDDKDQALVHTDYDGNRYSRAIIGRKADGTYVLLTVDVATNPNDLTIRYAGMGFDECNATLKHYGVVEAYQMDGGGSVTSILRNKDGEFDITNYTREGVRANMTGLLYVVRAPELKITETHHSLKIEQLETQHMSSTIQNIIVKLNDKEYKLENGSVEINGLEEETKYEMQISYDVVNNGSTTTYNLPINASTLKYIGEQPNFEINNSKTKINIINNSSSNIINIKVEIDNTEYVMEEKTLEINNLIGDTMYDINITYDIYDEESQNTYHRIHPTINITTLSYEVPSINTFEITRQSDNRIILKYKYSDPDNIIENASIKLNGEDNILSSSDGLQTFSNLDLTKNIYEMQLCLSYIVEGKTEYIYSEVLKAGKESSSQIFTITYILNGGFIENEPKEYENEIKLSDIPTPDREGYEFVEWEVNGKVESDSNKTLTGNLELVAVWSEITDEIETKPGGCQMGANIKTLMTLSTILGMLVIVLRKKR